MAEPIPATTDPRPDPPGAQAPRVLLVAEAARARKLGRALEDRARFRVTIQEPASSWGSAESRQFDAVVLYLDPTADIATQVRELRRTLPDAPVITVGGAGSDPEADECLAADSSIEAITNCVRFTIERRALREELAAAEMRFRSIIERNVDGIVIVDDAARIAYINPAAERLFGRKPQELLGEEFGVTVEAGETTEVDLVRGRGSDPVVAELRTTATTWEGAAAQLITIRDISDRKQAEERMKRLVWEQAARAQAEQAGRRSRFLVEAGATLDSSLDTDVTLQNLAKLIVPRVSDWCVIDLLEDGRIRPVAAAHALEDRLPLLDELRRLYPPRLDGRQPSSRVIASGETEVHRGLSPERARALAIDAKHAELLLGLGVRSIITVPLQAREQRIGAITFVCHQRDFTDEDVALAEEIGGRAGRALENGRLYEAALAANKAKADFLAVMSHELRTPLNAILGYTQLLLEGIAGEMEPGQHRYVERVHMSGSHLHQIIEEILVFASMESGRARVEAAPVAVGRVIEESVTMVEPLAREKGLEFVVDVSEPELVLFTDAVKVRQITLNLLTNAVKFTDAGRIALRTRAEGEWLLIEVEDTGSGIEADRIHTIFEPFRQVEGPLTRHAGGTGLGLTVSQRLAVMLGGGIRVHSEPGVGSTFTVRLPIRAHAAQQGADV